jgi:predicted outer membrane repeat protein
VAGDTTPATREFNMAARQFVRFVVAIAIAFLAMAPVATRVSGATEPLVWAPDPAGAEPRAPNDPPGPCYATPDGSIVFTSADAQAVRDALAVVIAHGTVKMAGYCAGVAAQGGTTQTALITQTITLAGGYTTTDWVTYNPAGNPTTLDAQLGGRVISATAAATLRGFTVTGGYLSSTVSANGAGINAAGALTLSEMIVSGNTLTGSQTSYHGGGAYIGGAASVSSTTFSNNTAKRYGGGLFAVSTLALTDTQFLSNTAYNTTSGTGGGAYANGAVTMNGGLFQSNAAGKDGGGLYANGTLALTGTQFLSNTAVTGGSGGGIHARSAVTLTNGLFQNNRTAALGGGLYANTTLLLTDAQFLGNKATAGTGNGGGAVAGSTATVNGGLFQGNTAGQHGGGLYAYAALSLSGTQFLSNTATFHGGGAYAAGAANLTAGLFQTNTAGAYGGGLYALSTLALTNTQFLSNTSASQGGGVSVSGVATLIGGLFQRNRSGDYGGGLIAESTLSLTGTQFLSNTAEWEGGGAYAYGAATLTNGLFQGNAASTPLGGVGGGLIAETTLSLTGTRFVRNAAWSGGGLFLRGGVNARVVNALFDRNSAGSKGAAIYVEIAAPLRLIHATIVSPTAPSGGLEAIHVATGTVYLTNTLIATHSVGIVRTNGSVKDWHTLFAGVGSPYIGTISSVGALTGTAGFVNPGAGDYHLGPASSAVNAGVDAGVYTDFEAEARPQAGGFDIGWDESPFALATWWITPTAGAGGVITPGAPQTVTGGGSIVFTVTADTGYRILDVGVDGVSQGALAVYTFTNVTADHTITAAFAIRTYLITPTAGAGGSITPGVAQGVNYSGTAVFTITPDTGYRIADVGVDGVSRGPIGSYTFTHVTADHTITAVFALKTHTLTMTTTAFIMNASPPTVTTPGAGSAGITPTVGAHPFTHGAIVTLTAVAKSGWAFAGWTGDADCVDGVVTMVADISCAARFETRAVYVPWVLR